MILYGIVELTLPFAPSSTVFIVQMAILGVLDGLFLTFIVPIAYDLTENTPELTNQAIGNFYHSINSEFLMQQVSAERFLLRVLFFAQRCWSSSCRLSLRDIFKLQQRFLYRWRRLSTRRTHPRTCLYQDYQKIQIIFVKIIFIRPSHKFFFCKIKPVSSCRF